MHDTRVTHTSVFKVNEAGASEAEDILAAEEPLEIRLRYCIASNRLQKSISITMRTPGNDVELAMGFLFTEGIIKKNTDIVSVEHIPGTDNNIIIAELDEEIQPDINRLERNFYTSSSCGVCGKASIDAVRIACEIPVSENDIHLPAKIIYQLPELLRKNQDVFSQTGGLHASALFDLQGGLLFTREDVGRHNALDKLIGSAFDKNLLPLDKYVLLLSGRASFELIQKAAMAGIRIVTAVGAPSSLAVQLAIENKMTLIGFLRDKRFNIYTGAERILINSEITSSK